EVPAARHRVVRLRDREALVEGAAREVRPREVADDVAIADRVVERDRVALVVGVAGRTGAVDQIVEGRCGDLRAARLVEDPDGRVDDLEVVVRADVAVRVGRPAGAPGVVREPGEAAAGRGGARGRAGSLEGRVARGAAGRRVVRLLRSGASVV